LPGSACLGDQSQLLQAFFDPVEPFSVMVKTVLSLPFKI
jgi:hypothetical protein